MNIDIGKSKTNLPHALSGSNIGKRIVLLGRPVRILPNGTLKKIEEEEKKKEIKDGK